MCVTLLCYCCCRCCCSKTFNWTLFILDNSSIHCVYCVRMLYLYRPRSLSCLVIQMKERKKSLERRMDKTGRRTFNHNNHTMLCIHVCLFVCGWVCVCVFCLALSIWADSFAFYHLTMLLNLEIITYYLFRWIRNMYSSQLYTYMHTHTPLQRERERQDGCMDGYI